MSLKSKIKDDVSSLEVGKGWLWEITEVTKPSGDSGQTCSVF